MTHRHFPRYIDDADFTTNAPSYYEDLARKEKLIRLLAERIWGYEKILDETLEQIQERFRAWDKILEDFPEDVKTLLQTWLDDGTLDHIINDTIFNWKLDTTIFEQFRDSITAQLAQIANATITYYLENPNKLKIGETIQVNGFYTEDEFDVTAYKVLAIDGLENFEDIGNGVFVGDDASVKVNNQIKLKVNGLNRLFVGNLGLKPNETIMKANIVASKILKNFTEVEFGVDTYFLHGSLIHQNNSVILGQGKKMTELKLADNINQYPIKSPTSVLDSFTLLYDSLTIKDLTLNGNSLLNTTRDYSGNVSQTFWGFGMFLSNISNLTIHDVKIKHTEAWGISYWLCDTVNAWNLEFEQVLGNGTNKDGITGSARIVRLNNLYGYTDDDMCAITTGKASLQERDTGVTFNIDVDLFEVNGVAGYEVDGYKTLHSIGVYAHGAKIKEVDIRNVHGIFERSIIRTADYWYDDVNRTTIERLLIDNVYLNESRNTIVFEVSNLDIKNVSITNIHWVKMINTTSRLILADNCKFDVLAVDVVSIKEHGPETSTTSILSGSNSSAKVLSLTNISGFSNVPGVSKNFYLFDTSAEIVVLKEFIGYGFSDISFPVNGVKNSFPNYKLQADELLVNSNHVKTLGSTVINNKKLVVKGNKLIVELNITLTIPDTPNVDYEILNLEDIPFKLSNVYGYAFMGGKVASLVFNGNTKRIRIVRPVLYGVNGTHTLDVYIEIPL